MDKTFIIAQVISRIKEAKGYEIGAALQEFLETIRISRTKTKLVLVDSTDWDDDDQDFPVPDECILIHKVYVDDVEIEQTLTEVEMLDGTTSTTDKCLIHENGTIYTNFPIQTSSTPVTIYLNADVYDDDMTIALLPSKFNLCALYYVLFVLYGKDDYLDEQKKVDNYSMYIEAYNKVILNRQSFPPIDFGDDF